MLGRNVAYEVRDHRCSTSRAGVLAACSSHARCPRGGIHDRAQEPESTSRDLVTRPHRTRFCRRTDRAKRRARESVCTDSLDSAPIQVAQGRIPRRYPKKFFEPVFSRAAPRIGARAPSATVKKNVRYRSSLVMFACWKCAIHKDFLNFVKMYDEISPLSKLFASLDKKIAASRADKTVFKTRIHGSLSGDAVFFIRL